MDTTVIVLWLVALIFIFITLKNLVVRAIKKRRCTKALTATVVEVKEKTSTRGRSRSHSGITAIEYLPIVSYRVDGTEYTKHLSKTYHADACAIGQTVELLVNPNKPSEINKKGASNKADIVILCIGLLMGVIGIILLMT